MSRMHDLVGSAEAKSAYFLTPDDLRLLRFESFGGGIGCGAPRHFYHAADLAAAALRKHGQAGFQKKQEAWKKEIGDWAVKNFSKATNLRTSYRSWNNTLNVDFDIITKESAFPVEPEKDFETIHQHTYREQKEDITNALTILKMTDEETVNASTMKQIARYL